jgi:hypothetical protein
MDSRQHRRVQLRLPARLRWTAPLGQSVEAGETIDVSRSGLLVSTKVPHAPGVSLWVTFPYDAASGDSQPEVLARVVRCQEVVKGIRSVSIREKNPPAVAVQREDSTKREESVRGVGVCEAPAAFAVAIHFVAKSQAATNGNSLRHDPDRRASPRVALAVPVRIRPEGIPWFEEAMTVDFSLQGLRFRSHREYQPGDSLKIAFEESASTPWSGSGEFLSRIVRVEPASDSRALDVIVCRVK